MWKPLPLPASKYAWLHWWAWLKHTVRTCVKWYLLAAYLAVVTIPVFLTVLLSFGATVALIAPVELAEYVLYCQAEGAANSQCTWARGFYVVSMGTSHWLTRVLSAYSTFLWGAAYHFTASIKHSVYRWAPEAHRPARYTPKQRHPDVDVQQMMYEEDKKSMQATETRVRTRQLAREEEAARRCHMAWQEFQQAAASVQRS